MSQKRNLFDKAFFFLIFWSVVPWLDHTLFSVEIEQEPKRYDLVICALFQDEEFFMKEWIEYHKLLGVQHFYLYNNLSTDHSLEILQPYIEAGEVELFHWPIKANNQIQMNSLQVTIYREALEIVKKTARWAAFIDIDEFLVPMQKDDLVSFLKEYENYPGVIVNWQMYGTSGYDSLPPGKLLTETLLFKAPATAESHHYFKSIVQPLFVADIVDPHSFHYLPGFFATNPEGILHLAPGGGQHPFILIDRIRLNHYWFGTKEWFIHNKLPRKEKWGLPKIDPEVIEEIIHAFNQVEDGCILRFVPALREKMFFK